MRVPVRIVRRKPIGPSWIHFQVPCRRTIWVRPGVKLPRDWLAHELCHVVQAERHACWPLAYFWQWLLSGMSYEKMPFEIEAHAAASDPGYLAWADDLLKGYN